MVGECISDGSFKILHITEHLDRQQKENVAIFPHFILGLLEIITMTFHHHFYHDRSYSPDEEYPGIFVK